MKLLSFFLLFLTLPLFAQENYLLYHESVQEIENKIIQDQLAEALNDYERLRQNYSFMFLRDVKVASQLAIAQGDEAAAVSWIKYGMDHGWKWSKIKKLPLTAQLSEVSREELTEYPESSPVQDPELRERVRDMIKKDQTKAFAALFRFSEKGRNNYAANKFAPHSNVQLLEMHEILDTKGYPGERLISEDVWSSTIICHHNSTGPEIVKKDTLFTSLYPKLMDALKRGEVSPFELAIMLDWRTTQIHDTCGLGFLTEIKSSTLDCSNERRKSIGLRSVESRNGLIKIEESSDINFFMHENPWLEGAIEIVQD